jgi:hypothetical protein
MAILFSGDLALEIRYFDYDAETWLHYAIWFCWQGEPLVRSDLLKAATPDWVERAPGAFHANEHRRDSLLPVLRHILETGEAADWEPHDEPDVCVAFYPNQSFPVILAQVRPAA